MLVLIFILLGLNFVFGSANLSQYDMMISDNGSKPFYNSSNLGICFGSNTYWLSYPYVVALRYPSGSACCTGSIISINPGIILTSAHCISCIGEILIGCNDPLNCNHGGIGHYHIQEFIQYPGYQTPLIFSNDIAIVLLNRVIIEYGARAIDIPSREILSGKSRLTGYGITQTGNIPTNLQTVESNIIGRQLCSDIMTTALGGASYVDNSMVCIRAGNAGSENVGTMCSGDSGGPQVTGNYIYGINSWVLIGTGTGCNTCFCCSGYPQVGTNVALFYNWINDYLTNWKLKYYNNTIN